MSSPTTTEVSATRIALPARCPARARTAASFASTTRARYSATGSPAWTRLCPASPTTTTNGTPTRVRISRQRGEPLPRISGEAA